MSLLLLIRIANKQRPTNYSYIYTAKLCLEGYILTSNLDQLGHQGTYKERYSLGPNVFLLGRPVCSKLYVYERIFRPNTLGVGSWYSYTCISLQGARSQTNTIGNFSIVSMQKNNKGSKYRVHNTFQTVSNYLFLNQYFPILECNLYDNFGLVLQV